MPQRQGKRAAAETQPKPPEPAAKRHKLLDTSHVKSALPAHVQQTMANLASAQAEPKSKLRPDDKKEKKQEKQVEKRVSKKK